MADSHEELVARWPVGTRVISNERAEAEYRGRFSTVRHGVIIGLDGSNIHVDWGGDFNGHEDHGQYNGHCWWMEERMIEAEDRLQPAVMASVDVVPQPVPRLRVTIARAVDIYGKPWQYRVENGPMVNTNEMKGYLDKSIIRKLPPGSWGHYDCQRLVNVGIESYGIDPQVFVDAITAASLAKQARDSQGTFTKASYDSDTMIDMATKPMLVAIGDQLFSLQPKGIINGSRALKIMRDRMAAAAKATIERVEAAAKVEAAGIVANAERQLAAARSTIELERQAMANVMVIPEWIAVNRLKVMKCEWAIGFNLAIGVELSTKISMIQMPYYDEAHDIHQIVKWHNITTIPNYQTVTAWVPFSTITGKYNYTSARLIQQTSTSGSYSWCLPHIGTNRCCMALQGMPETLKDYSDYKKIVNILNRGNSEINLNSLLWSFNSWHPDVQQQIPANVKLILDNECMDGPRPADYDHPDDDPWNEEWLDDAERVNVTVEAREIFNVDSLREARVSRREELNVDDDHLLITEAQTTETEEGR